MSEQKIFAQLPVISSIPLRDLTLTACIDISGSTANYFNGATVLNHECDILKKEEAENF